MKYNRFSRRHFLQGMGGLTLALPFLPSLLPKAQAAYFPGDKYFVAIGSAHGAVHPDNMYPEVDASTAHTLYSGDADQGLNHVIHDDQLSSLLTDRLGPLNPNVEGGAPLNNQQDQEISPVLGDFLNPYVEKMNVLRGIDIMWYIAHHRGGFLGRFRDTDDNGGQTGGHQLPDMPTIDQRMAESLNFYSATDTRTVKTIVAGNMHALSSGFANNAVERLPRTAYSTLYLFQTLFGTQTNPGNQPSNSDLSILDKVTEDYNSLVNSPFGAGRRISAADRTRLRDHLDHLRELEIRVRNQAQTCSNLIEPEHLEYIYNDRNLEHIFNVDETFCDVISMAFRCGASRIATMYLHPPSDFSGDWHQDIAHRYSEALPTYEVTRSNRFIAEHIFARLCENLDVPIVEGEDTTYLDNALIVWQHESGADTHDADSIPTVTAGSAGGFFRTNRYVDYRNRENLALTRWGNVHKRPGLPQNRWLYTVLESMGIQETEYKVGAYADMVGYGDPYVNAASESGHTAYPQHMLDDMGNLMPLIVA